MDDTLAFILHDGNLPGGIIYWNSIPDFEFVTGMIADQIYYISAVVGNKGVNGLPDIGDPCLSISNATPIVFYSAPIKRRPEITNCNTCFRLAYIQNHTLRITPKQG